jgi:hypothetical protein
MPWARDDFKQLRNAVYEVQYLWQEQQQQGLAKMAQDARHRQRHPRKIGEGVANKHLQDERA